jgi:serine/threonine protein kinase/tetratricopeptide (TPR) repeat protein
MAPGQKAPEAGTATVPAPISWGSFRHLRRLGTGGFGEVFEAWDPILERKVALKLLRRRSTTGAHDWNAALQEGRLLARIRHPNVVQVFGVDLIDGRVGIWMELVQGRTLEQLIVDHGPFSAREAMGIGIEICRALVAVHRSGLIHGDVKAQNVIREEGGRIVLMDFGLGRERPSDATSEQTSAGGTLLYMAPELLAGKPPAAASDIYALGVLLFHLVTVRFPVAASTLAELRARHSSGHVESLRDLRPDIPDQFTSIVERTISPDPVGRYMSAGHLERALVAALGAAGTDVVPAEDRRAEEVEPDRSATSTFRSRPRVAVWMAAGVLLLACALLIWSGWPEILRLVTKSVEPSSVLPSQRHLAVLPFRNTGGEEPGQALCDGLVETLTSSLTSLEQFQGSLWIVPATEVRDKNVQSVDGARREFGVTMAITGSIQTSDEELTVTVNLVDARTLRQIASAVIQDVPAVPGLQRDIAEKVAEMLQLRLQPEEMRRLSAGGTTVAEAYQLYLRGRGYLQRYDRSTHLESAVRVLNEAIDKDPTYALAHAGLAEAYYRKFEDTKERSHLDRAAELCRKSLQLDPSLAPVHAVQGLIQSAAGDHEKALASYSRALELDPVHSAAFRGLATTYEQLGRYEEAERTHRRAIGLRPGLWSGYNELGVFFANRGRYPEAITQFQHAVRLSPDNSRAHYNLGAIYYLTGDLKRAEAMLRKSLILSETPEGHTNLGAVYYIQGRYGEAAEQMVKAVARGGGDYRLWGNLADAYERLGNAEGKAREAYEKAIEQTRAELAINPHNGEVRAHLAYYLAKTAHPREARAELHEALRASGNSGAVFFRSAIAFELLGERKRALETLGRAMAAGHSFQEIDNAPALENLRRDPGYEKVRQKRREPSEKGR